MALDDLQMEGDNSNSNTYDDLDKCINDSRHSECLSTFSLIRGRKPTKRSEAEDSRPIAFVRFNTRQGKPKPVSIRALLDSGAAEMLVSDQFTKKLRQKKASGTKTVWTTPAGTMATTSKVRAQFTLPELHDDKLIDWDVHVTSNLGAYDMIIGRDILEFLK